MSNLRTGPIDQLRVHETRPRATPPPAGRQFRDVMAQAAARVLGGLEAAAPLVPGGALVGLAARGASSRMVAPSSNAPAAGSGGDLAGLGGSGALGGPTGGANETLELLALQRDIGLEQQRYSVLSNVLKARHETARSVIQNVR